MIALFIAAAVLLIAVIGSTLFSSARARGLTRNADS